MCRRGVSKLLIFLFLILAVSCRRDSNEGIPPGQPPFQPVEPIPPPLAELSPEEIQQLVVGTWKADGKGGVVIAFDAKSRVSFLGIGTDAQESDPSIVEGKVTYEIIAPSDPPQLRITHPAGKLQPIGASGGETIGMRFEIRRDESGDLTLTEADATGESGPGTFSKSADDALSVIDEEEEAKEADD